MFKARTEAQRTQREGAFNCRLKVPFSTEKGGDETSDLGEKVTLNNE